MAKNIIHSETKPSCEKTVPMFDLDRQLRKQTGNNYSSKAVTIQLVLTKVAVDRLSQWINLKKVLDGVPVARHDVSLNFAARVLRATDDQWESVTIASNDLGEI